MKVHFDTEFLYLTYDEDKRLGQAVWNGFLKGEHFKEACLACIKLVEEQQPLYWLADNRKMKAIRQQDQEWFAQEIIPRLAHSSLRKMATLVSEDIFNQMAVENLELKAIEVVRFDNYHFKSEAEAWLWLTQSAIEAQAATGGE